MSHCNGEKEEKNCVFTTRLCFFLMACPCSLLLQTLNVSDVMCSHVKELWARNVFIIDGILWKCIEIFSFSVFCYQGKNIIVFYGSQTGTGEEFANRLSKDAQRYGMKGMAADPEEYDMVHFIATRTQIPHK